MSLSYTVPVAGSTLNSIADPEVATALSTILNWANGNIQPDDIAAALAQSAGVNQTGQTTKGTFSKAGSDSTSATSPSLLATPDEVAGVMLSAAGLLVVWYQAIVQLANTSSFGHVGIFLNGVQARMSGVGAQQVQGAVNNADTNPHMISTGGSNSSPDYVGMTQDSGGATTDPQVTTGEALGSASGSGPFVPLFIFAGAGTYVVSARFWLTSAGNTLTASNRRLYVQALSFA